MLRLGLSFIPVLLLVILFMMSGAPVFGHTSPQNYGPGHGSSERKSAGTSPQDTSVAPYSTSPTYALAVAGSDNPSPDDGNVYRFENGNLSFIARPTTLALRDVGWLPGGAYSLIVGFGATVLKYDGSIFIPLNAGVPTTRNFHDVEWRPDGAFALITGSSGTLVKYDGLSFTTISTPVTTTIRSISWRSNSYATLVGAAGTMLFFENDQVHTFISGTTSDLHTVEWNPNGEYALVGGASGTILRHDGFVNTPVNTTGIYDPSHVIRAVAWNNTGLALISGDTGLVLSYNGTTLTRQLLDGSPNATNSNLHDLEWFQGNATIVGGSGTVLEFSGILRKLANTTNASLRDIEWRPYVALSVNFTISPSPPSVRNPAIFSGVQSGGLPPYAFEWDFGDGTSGTGATVAHTYNTAGNRSVSLTVTDGEGVIIVSSRTLTVTPWPPEQFEPDWADYDNSGQVNILDISVIAFCYDQDTNSSGWLGCVYWDIDLNGEINIIDVALLAFYYDTILSSPFPGQGEQPGNLDPEWEQSCGALIPFDRQYCMSTFG